MVEFTNKTVAGLLVLVMVLSGGATYMLKPTGNYRTCTSGWELVTSGENEGRYGCADRPGVFYDCVDVRDTKTTGRENYYCDEAVRVELQEPEPVQKVTEKVYIEKVCPDFVSYTESGKTICTRYSDGSTQCSEEYAY